ncbi:MAG: nucleotidyltransferase domain-containing protein [Bacteroidetes bacterium]|nr:nucleotidyltransferase domain-containing protein [Bacteroidota bacterium]
MTLVQQHIDQIRQLCKAHHVKSLFAFGSVVSGTMTKESDVDLVVDIDRNDPFEYSDDYFALKFQLESICDRRVELLEAKSITNPFLKKQIDTTKALVYGR